MNFIFITGIFGGLTIIVTCVSFSVCAAVAEVGDSPILKQPKYIRFMVAFKIHNVFISAGLLIDNRDNGFIVTMEK